MTWEVLAQERIEAWVGPAPHPFRYRTGDDAGHVIVVLTLAATSDWIDAE